MESSSSRLLRQGDVLQLRTVLERVDDAVPRRTRLGALLLSGVPHHLVSKSGNEAAQLLNLGT